LNRVKFALITFSALTCAFTSNAQVPADVRESLSSRQVVTSGRYVYATAEGPLRGTREASEELLVTRAMRGLVHQLCEFDLSPGKRLEASLSGVSLVASTTKGKAMEVVIRVPVQKPSCKVIVVDSAIAAPTPATKLEATCNEDTQIRLTESKYTRSQDIVIRIFSGEY